MTFPADHLVVLVDGVSCCGYCGEPVADVRCEPHDVGDLGGYEHAFSVLWTVEPCGHRRVEASGDTPRRA